MAEYVPPPNFVGEVSFAITLLVGTGAGCTPAAACTGDPSPRREQATLQSTVTSSYAFATCMEDTAFCGEHGTCQGPSGCLCQEHWFGVQCNVETSKLEEGEYTWRGWKYLFIVMFLGPPVRPSV